MIAGNRFTDVDRLPAFLLIDMPSSTRSVTRFQELDDGPGTLGAGDDGLFVKWDNATTALVMAAAAGGGINWENTLVVDQAGGGDYTTIQAAINASTPTEADRVGILVMPGQYDEAITIKDHLDLVGFGEVRLSKSVGSGQPWVTGNASQPGHAKVFNFYFKSISSVPVAGDDFVTTNNNVYFYNCRQQNTWAKTSDRYAIEGGTWFGSRFTDNCNFIGGVYNSCTFQKIGEGTGCTFNFCDITALNFFTLGAATGSINFCRIGTIDMSGNTSVETASPMNGCVITTLDSTSTVWFATGKTFNFNLCQITTYQATKTFSGTINFNQCKIATLNNSLGNMNGTYNPDALTSIGTVTGTLPTDFTNKLRFETNNNLVVRSYNDAGRPAAGRTGRIIFNTDDGKLNIDNGTNWTLPDGTTT